MPGKPIHMTLILAGGKSRRMQQDKRQLPIEGQTMIGRIIGLAERISEKILISANDHLPEFDRHTVIADREAGAGPLHGLTVSLSDLEVPFLLILSCDMPFVSAGMIRQLTTHHVPGYYTLFRHQEEIQPFPGILDGMLFEKVVSMHASGTRSFRELFGVIPLNPVQLTAESIAEAEKMLMNINSPEDYDNLSGRC